MMPRTLVDVASKHAPRDEEGGGRGWFGRREDVTGRRTRDRVGPSEHACGTYRAP
jgi:hypothetical protein